MILGLWTPDTGRERQPWITWSFENIGQTRVHNNPVTCDNYQPITCLSSSIQESTNKRVCSREPDFWGTLSRSYFVSHDTMLEQFSVSDRKLGRGGHWGDSQLVINGLYPTFIPPSRSPHHLPSLANCLTFQFCSAPLHRDQSHSDVKWWSPEERENQGPGPEPSEIWNFSKTWPATSDAWPQELSKNHGASANIRHRWVLSTVFILTLFMPGFTSDQILFVEFYSLSKYCFWWSRL